MRGETFLGSSQVLPPSLFTGFWESSASGVRSISEVTECPLHAPCKHLCPSGMPAPCSASGPSPWLWWLSDHKTEAETSHGGECPESNGEILEDGRTKKVFLPFYRFCLPSSSYLLSSFFISSFHFHLQILFPDPRDLAVRRLCPTDNQLPPNPN